MLPHDDNMYDDDRPEASPLREACEVAVYNLGQVYNLGITCLIRIRHLSHYDVTAIFIWLGQVYRKTRRFVQAVEMFEVRHCIPFHYSIPWK